MFRYSFKRTRYAQLLRSALVVNFVALIIFALIIVLMGYISILLDYAFFDGDLSTYFTPDFNSEQLAEILQAMDAESPSDLWFNQISILGLDFMQLVTGACLVGVTGFVSSGFLGAMIWGRRENGMLLLAILFGLIHSFGKVYGKVKDKSAKLLAMAESQIVDVGQGAPPKRPPPADTTPDIGLDICSYYRAGVEPNLSHYYRSKEVTQLPNEVVPPPNVKTHTGADSPLPEDNLEIETLPDEIPARHGADSPLPENNLEIETVPDEVPARHQDFADSYRNSYDRLLGGLDQDQPLQAAA